MTDVELAYMRYSELEDFLDACFKRAPNLPFTQLSHKTQKAYDRWQELLKKETCPRAERRKENTDERA